MKSCFKCGESKPLTEFYRHPQMGDGHLNKCKTCAKQDMRVDRHTKPRVRAYDRNRAKLPHRITLARKVTKTWRAAHPERVKAHQLAERAHVTGPTTCEACGLEKRLERHHPDYSQPLLVMWLCKVCHAIADKVRRATERTAS